MQKILSDFIKEKKQLELEERKKELIDLGLLEKVYSSKEEPSSEYPFAEWSEEEQKEKYYKKVPIEVSDEDYAQLCKYTKTDNENTIASIIQFVAWLGIIVGIIIGFCFRKQYFFSSYCLDFINHFGNNVIWVC
ncbi:MAG: hypothetical protein N2Z65_03530 [Clostridiales bacterium]|nr:hypothetical protein [Clostridiales bacterium]